MVSDKVVVIVETRGAEKAKKDIQGISKSASGAVNPLNEFKKAVAGVVSLYTLNRMSHMIDSWVELQNRIKLSTNSIIKYNDAFTSIRQVAYETRSELTSVAMAYNRAAISSEKLGLSANQLENVVRTVNQTLKISGSTAQESRASLIQFFQGVASGQLRGEEFRSVTEANIRLTKLLKDELAGGDLGKLREMAFSGQLTADKVIGAILRNTNKINEEFKLIATKISEIFVKGYNEITAFLGRLNDTYGITNKLNKSFEWLRNNTAEVKAALLGMAYVAIPALIGILGSLMITLAPFLVGGAIGLGFMKLYEYSGVFRSDLEEMGRNFKTLGKDIKIFMDKHLFPLGKYFEDFDLDFFLITWQLAFAQLFAIIDNAINRVTLGIDYMINSVKNAMQKANQELSKIANVAKQGKPSTSGMAAAEAFSKAMLGDTIYGAIYSTVADKKGVKAVLKNVNPLDAILEGQRELNTKFISDTQKSQDELVNDLLRLQDMFLKKYLDNRNKRIKMGKAGEKFDEVIQEELTPIKPIDIDLKLRLRFQEGSGHGQYESIQFWNQLIKSQKDAYTNMVEEYYYNMTKTMAEYTENLFSSLGDSIVDNITNALTGAMDSWREFAHQMSGDLAKLMLKMLMFRYIIDPLVGLGGASYSQAPGTGSFMGISLEGRASGGDVNANTPYIVGEKQPEIFVPNTNGTIIPNTNSLGSSSPVVNNYVVLDSDMPEIFAKSKSNEKATLNTIKVNKEMIKQWVKS